MKNQKKVLQRIIKIKPCFDKCNWEGINYPSEKDDWKKFEKNNLTSIAVNVLYVKNERMYPAYVSKHNSKQVNLLMIPNGEKWHYLAVKKLSALLRGITSKTNGGDFYCLNCFHPIRTKSKL